MLSELRSVAGFTAFIAIVTGLSALSRQGADRLGEADGFLVLFLVGLSIAVFIIAWKAKSDFDSQEKMDKSRREEQRKIEESERKRQSLYDHRRKVLDQTLRRYLIEKIGAPAGFQLEILQFRSISPVRFIVAAVSIHAKVRFEHFSSNSFFAVTDINSLVVENIVFVDHGAAIFREPVFQAFHHNPNADLLESIETVYPLAETVLLDIE